jgi:hypothetical protein
MNCRLDRVSNTYCWRAPLPDRSNVTLFAQNDAGSCAASAQAERLKSPSEQT